GFLAFTLTRHRIDTWLNVDPSPSPTVSATPTGSPTAEASPAASAAATATPTASATPGTATTPAASSVKLRVLNGTEVTGAAGKAKTLLEAAGFTVRAIGNAKTQDYPATKIYYQAGKSAEADLVKAK